MYLGMPILFECKNLEENFIIAKDLGLDFVELNLNFPYCRYEMENSDVYSLLKKYNLKATLHFYDEYDAGLYTIVTDAYLKLLEQYIKVSHEYIELVNFHNNPGPVVTISGIKNYIYKLNYDEYIKEVISSFEKIKKILNKYDVDFVIENVDGCKGADFLIDNYKYFKENNYLLNIDIGHDHVIGEPLYEYAIKNNLRFKEFHFHDGNNNTCHLSLGDGNIDLSKYKKLINDDSYVVLEVKSKEDLIKSVNKFKEI